MNRRTPWLLFTLIGLMWVAGFDGCSCNPSNKEPEAVAVESGSGQSTTVNTQFGAPLVAVVTKNGSGLSGVQVTFTAPANGASGTFQGGSTTANATTDANGSATSPTFTANGTTGTYTVTAAVSGVANQADFSLTNTAVSVTTENFVFYASGQEAIDDGPNFYAVAGVVTINTSTGAVVGGEEDYNDGFADDGGILSVEPGGDSITSGQLTISSTTGQGTLTLITNDPQLGPDSTPGTETFGVQFVNAKHALVTQFDGSATSSGSMDLQTSTATPSNASFAFTSAGVDPEYDPIVFGGVFTIGQGDLSGGSFDVDDAGTVEFAQPFTTGAGGVVINSTDALGRGTVSNAQIAASLAYYVIGPEVIRLIDIDTTDSAVGSAYGQGSGTFSASSLTGTFVFADQANPWDAEYGAIGMFTTDPGAGTYSGVADDNEGGNVFAAEAILNGTYSICGAAGCGGNGYGSLTIPDGDLAEVATLGVYMTDPALNLNDPNNTTSGQGGALLADLDSNLVGTGVIVPQTSTSTSDFANNYAFGAQGFVTESAFEYDFVGQGSVTASALDGSSLISDPFELFDEVHTTFTGATFVGTATPDGVNAGRYLMTDNPLVVTPPGDQPVDFMVVLYQASGGQLFWLDEDDFSLWVGPLEQQAATVTPLAAAKSNSNTQKKTTK